MKRTLWLVRVSVPPAKEEYSPPEREVGMLITGMQQGLGDLGLDSAVRFERSVSVWTLFASACGDISSLRSICTSD